MGRLLAAVGGLTATLVLCVRLQLEALQALPGADGIALVAGWLGAGLVAGFTVIAVARPRTPRRWLWALGAMPLILVAAGCLSLSFFPRGQFQTEALRSEWSQLHPALRSALWVVSLADPGLVVTDLGRVPADYAAMGLATPAASAHFLSPRSGYARAADVRLRDAGPWRRWARQGLFLALGLRAEAHAGTADHLHVSLPQRPTMGPTALE